MQPTVILTKDPKSVTMAEEIFGPVLVSLNVETTEEAIDLINANEYGNGAAVSSNLPWRPKASDYFAAFNP